MQASLPPLLDRIRKRSLLVGGVAALICLVGYFTSQEQFFRSYLFAYIFWVGLALGSLAILMLHHLVGGNWGFVSRRILESGTRTLPLMAVLFLPILLGLQTLYPWARPVEGNELLEHKAPYLNIPFFSVRLVIYFGIWITVSFFLNRWSAQQDRTGDPATGRRLQGLSGPGLVLFGLTVTFAAIDWGMSLEPEWFSTVYGVLYLVGQVLAMLSVVIIMVALLRDTPPFSERVSPKVLNDLGNLLLAFVMLWAYISFTQYLIIWSANLPEETTWYSRRTDKGWQWLALGLVLFHFMVPILVLLSRRSKRNVQTLAIVAGFLLFMRLVDVFWLVTPAFPTDGISVHWLDGLATVGLGGIWIAGFLGQLGKRPLLPLKDPRFVTLIAGKGEGQG